MNVRCDTLDAEAIRSALSAAVAGRLDRIECVGSIDSTSAELLRRGAEPSDLAVLIADAQTAGRGRRGRVWASPPGANLYLSLLRRIKGSPRSLAGLSLAVGVACAEALHALGHVEVQLKWPNDLLARGRKLGGVLIDLAPSAAIIGLGLNLRMPSGAASSIDQPWIDLATLGATSSRNQVAAAVLDHLIPTLDRFESEGLEPFRTRWIALDALAGRDVQLIAGAEQHAGRALGIASDGGLRVRLAQGERIFHSADVTLHAT